MRAESIATGLAVVAAAALVGWIRLVPLGLPAVEARAQAAVRQRHGSAIAALEARADPAMSPAERTARVERAVDRWIEKHPADFARQVASEADALRSYLQGTRADGRPYVLLGDLDSYLWLREARTLLRTGSGCGEVVDGVCRDTATLAPVGTTMRYGGSLHTLAIAAVHWIATRIDAEQPLPLSAYWVHVIVGVLGVPAAFAIGRRLAGAVGGLFAAVACACHPVLLKRSLGSDNDVWNSVLPLYMAWALVRALDTRSPRSRIAWAVLAGVLAGAHAAIWSGWVFGVAVLLGGLATAAAVAALRLALASRRAVANGSGAGRPTRSVAATVVVAAVFYVCAGVGGVIADNERSAFAVPLRGLAMAASMISSGGAAPVSPAADHAAIWPSPFGTVGELWRPTLGAIAGNSYGAPLFFVSWIGLLLLLLPRAHWRVAHFVILIGGTLLYRYLLTAEVGARLLIALLMLPVAAAVAVRTFDAVDADDDSGPALLVVVWLLGALFLSFAAYRFILLLAAPLGIAAGVAVGRLHLWLDAHAARQRLVPPRLARAAAAVALAATIILPARVGQATAAEYTPLIDRAWVDTLDSLRATSPPDAILNAWWDYGYWIAYVGERRVSADGGSLQTRVPFWLAQAQLAPSEAETVGLLRMLNCGSDAAPYPEGDRSARARLRQAGLDDLDTAVTLARIAALSRAEADADLSRRGLDDAARAGVLAASHCTPPPSFLILSTDQQTLGGWWQLGSWDPRRAYLAGPLRTRPEAEAVGHLVALGYSDREARELYRTAAGLDPARLDGFVAPGGAFYTPTWIRCAPRSATEWRCPMNVGGSDGRTFDALVYSAAAPADAVIEAHAGDAASRLTPGVVLLANPDGIAEIAPATPGDARLAVLIDPSERRALIGTPNALRSTYTALVHLDGRYAKRLRKVDDQSGYRGERITTWAIDWSS